MKKRIVLATRNSDKVREIIELLASLDAEILPLTSFADAPEVEEDGHTLEANALKKARTIARHTGLPAVADDTGLEVDYLDGAPGVYSSRFAGEHASYADNVKKLLEQLRGVPREKRSARFRCVVAYVDGDLAETVSGECQGVICEEPHGNRGFGYDPVFYVPEYGCTFAEMELETKNKISHRAKAFSNFKHLISNLIHNDIGA